MVMIGGEEASEDKDRSHGVLLIDIKLCFRSNEAASQQDSVMGVTLGVFPPVSFDCARSGGGAFMVCQNISLDDMKKVNRLSLVVLSRQGLMQSAGSLEYERGLLRPREPSRYTPPHALDGLPMLLICYEEFKIKLYDATTRVHQQSLSSYDSDVTLAVSVYDMSVTPEGLKIGPTGRIITDQQLMTSSISYENEGGEEEAPPPPPPEEEEEEDDSEDGEWMPEAAQRYRYNNEDGEEDVNPKEQKELQELAALFNVTLKTAQRHQTATEAEKENKNNNNNSTGSKRAGSDKREDLRVSLSLDDVLAQMRLHQEQGRVKEAKEARRKWQAATAADGADADAGKAEMPPSLPLEEVSETKKTAVSKRGKGKPKPRKRAPLSAPLSKYVAVDTGKVVKRPFLRKGSGDTRRRNLRARSQITNEQGGKAPLARRGAPVTRVESGSHADKHKLTIGPKTSRSIIQEANRVSTVRLAQSGEAIPPPRKPPVPPYREKKDKFQEAREEALRRYVETANANATASASAWQFKNAQKIDSRSKQQLVATWRSVTGAKEQRESVAAGTGEQRYDRDSKQITAWRPPVTKPNPEPLIFVGGK